MNRLEKCAAHGLGYLLFLAAFLNIVLACGGTVQAWELPASYSLYVVGALAWRMRLGHRPTWRQIGLAVGLPLVLLLVAYGLHFAYDTSWDGQDYQQSAVIELAHGWNPWQSASLPLQLPVSSEYVQGYPKSTWLIQASVYKFTGRLQMAPITNVVVAAIAAVLVFGVLRRLRLGRLWSVAITALAVLQIHFLQQLPTFMADGYSYQLGLIALASLLFLILDKVKAWPLAMLLTTELLLAGGKYSNLFVCGLLGLAMLLYAWRSGLYRERWAQRLGLLFAAIAALVLWVPFGTNTLRYHSPLYPQNLPNETAKLRYDNVPNNLKHSNRPALLFYGIFSAPESNAGANPASPQNVARLKVPFTFHRYEIQVVNNFQGRVGSGGILFSGILVAALAVLGVLSWRRPKWHTRHLLAGAWVLIASILVAALVIPVSNKLRYSPLVTLIPLVVLTLLAAARPARPWMRVGMALLAGCIAANTTVAAAALLPARVRDTQAINRQLRELRSTGATYQVSVGNFYSNYQRLQDAGVPVQRVGRVSCAQPLALQASFDTTLLCAAAKPQ